MGPTYMIIRQPERTQAQGDPNVGQVCPTLQCFSAVQWMLLSTHSFVGWMHIRLQASRCRDTTLQCYLDVAGAIRGALKEPALYLSMYAVGLTQTSSLVAG